MACRCAPWNGEYDSFYKTCGASETPSRRDVISPSYIGEVKRTRQGWTTQVSTYLRSEEMSRGRPTRQKTLGVCVLQKEAKGRVEAWLQAVCEHEHGPGFSGFSGCRRRR